MKFGVFGSGEIICSQIKHLLGEGHKLVFIVPDPNSDFLWEDFNSFVIHDLPFARVDFIIVNEYRKLIDVDSFDCPIFNFHSGDLPRRRGNSSNLMAFLNGESIVMSVHLMNKLMDDGPVIGKTVVDFGERVVEYKEIREAFGQVCVGLLDNVLYYLSNPKADFCEKLRISEIDYSIPLKPEDGIILDFSWPSRYYLQLWRLFSNGTGVFVKVQSSGNLIEVKSLEICDSKRTGLLFIGGVSNRESDFHFINIAEGYLKVTLCRPLKIGTRLAGCKLHYIV